MFLCSPLPSRLCRPSAGDTFKIQSDLLERVLFSSVPPQVENEWLHCVLSLIVSRHTRDLFTWTEIYTLRKKTHFLSNLLKLEHEKYCLRTIRLTCKTNLDKTDIKNK